ncbi:TetR/AcrR family transcriptional regulator [Mycolicibacterium fluoranthenivorans]|uniref:TetR/AcrR family transcriptional regulator n=2 Tax=Mycolicibacterium fluoranthenivorans TaxID=258505 RepID=A0A7G8PFG7_9MYCO|nr:TetR/AcrR family transcriptional regulator [Mycolicibacterium fluoranthenivorans]QNJ93083.1 TetR/AcrR family transcriptional regulator [Mycolicibacterium fluoranthenivorans]
MSPAMPTRETKATRTRARILDSAAAELVEHGYSGSSLRRIAEGADLQPGSLYFHFETKDELVLEVLRDTIARATKDLRQAIDDLGPQATPGEQLRTAIAAHTRSLHMSGVRGSAVARVAETLPPALRRRYANSATSYTRLWNQLLIAAQSAGDLDSELDVRAVRDLLFSAMNGTLAYRDQASSRIEQATQTLIRLVFRV